MKYNADVNIKEFNKLKTPLHEATGPGNKCDESTVKSLIAVNGVDLNAKDTDGRTPLHYLAINSTADESLYKCYLESNCDINVQDNDGKTPLHFACEGTNDDAMAELLRYGADLNIEDDDGNTALCDVGCQSEEPFYHIQKLDIAGLYIGEKIKLAREEEAKIYHMPSWLEKDFSTKCEAELDKMKKFKVDQYTPVYDILFKNQQEMVKHAKNTNFIKIMESSSFESNFPLYGGLVKMQFKRGSRRSALVEPAKESMEFITGLSLPYACIDYIFKYLDNKAVEKLIDIKRSSDCNKRKQENGDGKDCKRLDKMPRVE